MKKFEEAMMDIVCFDAEDVISTSNETPEIEFSSLLDLENQMLERENIEAK